MMSHRSHEVAIKRQEQLQQRLTTFASRIGSALQAYDPFPASGRVTKVIGTIVHAVISGVEIGEMVTLRNRQNGQRILAEVVGFAGDQTLLAPYDETQGLTPTTEVWPTGEVLRVGVGPGLLGRVLDGLGRIIDDKVETFLPQAFYPVYRDPPDALTRRQIEKPISTGVRALDGLLTIGEGQRVGIFAAAGGGKSTLLSMLVKGADVDVTVIALIGERGREVRDFIEQNLGPEAMASTVIVVATSDKSAMERAKASFVATAIAEYFRDQHQRVLFLMDSVTRFARAQREIGLAAGEPPTRRGYPPSVFANLAKLMERGGMSEKGSMTALYTVLVEGDDMTEPVADETMSILDGHIVLSRKLAASHHYPAIDILQSKSRVMNAVVDDQHQMLAAKAKDLLAAYDEVELLVRVGEYKAGSDARSDLAIEKNRALNEFLRQGTSEPVIYEEAINRLRSILA